MTADAVFGLIMVGGFIAALIWAAFQPVDYERMTPGEFYESQGGWAGMQAQREQWDKEEQRKHEVEMCMILAGRDIAND